MKRIAFLILLLLPSSVGMMAQQPIFDAERLFQTAFNFSDEMTESIRQTGMIIDQLDKTHKIYQNWQKVAEKLSVVSEYVGRLEDIEEIYSMIKQTVGLLAYGKDVILDENYLNVNRKLGYVNSLISMSTTNLDNLQNMVRRYSPGSKEGGNMDDGQREDMKQEDMATAHAVIEQMRQEIAKARREADAEKMNKASFCSAMSALGGCY